LVDNTAQSYMLQPRNGIPITTWVGDYSDQELMTCLLPFLRVCATAPDVRTVITASVGS
jgi:TFIIF-interacting CTD phosphatase-like protein